jgi:hypothetical protein
MKQRRLFDSRTFWVACGLLILAGSSARAGAEAPADAVSAFNAYIDAIEARLAMQHHAADSFLVGLRGNAENERRVHGGERIVEQVTPLQGKTLPGAMLHHWRGTAFAPGATAADLERLLRDFDGYPKTFAPQVVRAKGVPQSKDRVQAWMRVRQRHVITVVMDSSYDVDFERLDARHGFSISRSTRIAEIGSPGTSAERVLDAKEEHGFLWRLDTYWSYEERDGGLYMQIESVSLTRAIPAGLVWAVRPFVESVPRESLEFTLRSACEAVQR